MAERFNPRARQCPNCRHAVLVRNGSGRDGKPLPRIFCSVLGVVVEQTFVCRKFWEPRAEKR